MGKLRENFCFFLIFFLLFCSAKNFDELEIQVFKDFLAEHDFFGNIPSREETSEIKKFIIREETKLFLVFDWKNDREAMEFKEKMARSIPNIKKETIESFFKNNLFPRNISGKLGPSWNIEYLDEMNDKQLFKSGGNKWRKFYQRYPDSLGVRAFSRVGFDKRGRQALLFVEERTGGKSGVGNFFLLVRKNNTWDIKYKLNGWIS
jgi:hypothetical protein